MVSSINRYGLYVLGAFGISGFESNKLPRVDRKYVKIVEPVAEVNVQDRGVGQQYNTRLGNRWDVIA